MATKTKVQFSDKPEVHAGIVGAILALMPAAVVAVHHRVLATMVAEYEAAKSAWKAAADRLSKAEKDVKQAEADFSALIAALPVVAAAMLRIRRPVPGNTDYTMLDKGVRFDDLVAWIRAGGSPLELECAQALEEDRARLVPLRAERDAAEAQEHATKQAFGNARIKLSGVVRETELFIRLNAAPGSPALQALTKPRKSGPRKKKGGQQPEPKPAANTDAVIPAPAANADAATPEPAPVPVAKPA